MSPLFELRTILRTLLRTPGYSAAVVITLALGIGANAAIFSVVDAVLLRPLPYEDPERVFRLREHTRFSQTTPMSPHQIEALRRGADWADVQYLDVLTFNLDAGDGAQSPERLDGAAVSPGFFRMLGVTPVLGRDFEPASPEAPPASTVLITHDLWQSRFGGRRDVLGKALEMSWGAAFGPNRELDDRFTVIGVLPEDFLPPYGAGKLFVPSAYPRQDAPRDFNFLFPFARIAERDPQQAREALSARVAALPPPPWRTGDEPLEVGVALQPVGQASVARVRSALWILWGAVALVLLAACANVANLMLARNARRRREIEVRRALGASRGRLLRWLLTESLVLSLAATLVGLGLAWATLQLLHALGPGILPRLSWITVDTRLLAFGAAVAAATTLLFGVLPAWLASRRSSGSLRSASAAPGARRLSGGLVIAQVALSVVLVVHAALLVRSFRNLQAVDLGFDTARLATFEVSLPPARYPEAEERSALQQQMLDAVSTLPGVASAAITSALPMTLINTASPLLLPGGSEDGASPPRVSYRQVTAGYFETLGIPQVSGQPFDPRDVRDEPKLALINQRLAEQLFSGRSPIGQTVGLPAANVEQATIIGVVGDVRQSGPMRDVRPTVYLPALGSQSFGVVARLHQPAAVGRSELAAAVARVDAAQPIHGFRTWRSPQDRWLGRPMFNAWAMGLFGTLALTVSVFGLLAVLSTSVSQRTTEIGIRQALGASLAEILRLVSRQGLVLVLTGAVIGLGLALASASWIASLLHGVAANDPLTLLVAAGGSILIALPAILVPARRATAIAPAVALRSDA